MRGGKRGYIVPGPEARSGLKFRIISMIFEAEREITPCLLGNDTRRRAGACKVVYPPVIQMVNNRDFSPPGLPRRWPKEEPAGPLIAT